MTKVERLIALIYLLRRRRNLRARDIAEELGVSERTVYRDLASLNEAFQGWVRIIFRDEGYFLDPSTFPPPLRLTGEELEALRVAAEAAPAESPHSQRLKQAVSKILSLHAERRILPDLEEILAITPPAARDKVPWRTLQNLEEAIRNRIVLQVRYFSFSAGQETEHLFEPYLLAFRKHAWYLFGHCRTHGQPHLLRASRLRQVRRTEERFPKPTDLSPEKVFAQSWQVFGGEPIRVHLRFSPRIAPLIEELEWHPSQRLQWEKDGSLLFTALLPSSPELTAWVLSWGADCEVLEPEELRSALREEALRLAHLYEISPPQGSTDKD